MKTITFTELSEQIARNKARIGWVDDEASTEALRNSGRNRTAAKRELLARAEVRAKAAGRKPVVSHR